MITVQVATKVWLVLDEVHRPRYLIVHAPAVHRATGETHILYRLFGHSVGVMG